MTAEDARERIAEWLLGAGGGRVLSGPFAGMRYVRRAVGSQLAPKLLGTYEQELHPLFAEILGRGYPQILNVGCGEGYYAVGLALRLPGAVVRAYDLDPAARVLCAMLARENDVPARVFVHAACGHGELQERVRPGDLVVSDCEGAELELLRPDLVPVLRECDLLVELHDFLAPAITGTLLERFAPSHACTLIPAVGRGAADFDRCLTDASILDRAPHWSAGDKEAALDECRPEGMQWAFMGAKRGLGQPTP